MYGPKILKAARALAGWKQSKLAQAADVNVNTVVRLESETDWEKKWETPTVGTLNKIRKSLEKAGVEFIEKDERSEDGGPGVRLKN
ncbi:helix-turn-helix domain-containing protein [Paremcibacter congregatus]|uniref:helix-turn-helix transcriptional regulator n=1 Tax=Paremcibacter congregatus TaxID=2043170 RepID=UPI0030EECDC8|tara:strand:+ start:3095 stop:3352 length:258 start_codon:yes stop_codon:yes gene_type:complete